jgi:polar amino acid transport system substrate-binding protein
MGSTGQIDAFVHDQPILAWLAKKEFGSGIEVRETVFDKQNYAIALPKGSPLRAKINLVLVSGHAQRVVAGAEREVFR